MDMCQTKKGPPAARVNVPPGPHMEMVHYVTLILT